jgi:hypothetical protein
MNKLFLVRKDLVLAIGTLLLVIACYQLAVKQTVQLWQLHRQLVLQAGEADGVSYQPDYLVKRGAGHRSVSYPSPVHFAKTNLSG